MPPRLVTKQMFQCSCEDLKPVRRLILRHTFIRSMEHKKWKTSRLIWIRSTTTRLVKKQYCVLVLENRLQAALSERNRSTVYMDCNGRAPFACCTRCASRSSCEHLESIHKWQCTGSKEWRVKATIRKFSKPTHPRMYRRAMRLHDCTYSTYIHVPTVAPLITIQQASLALTVELVRTVQSSML